MPTSSELKLSTEPVAEVDWGFVSPLKAKKGKKKSWGDKELVVVAMQSKKSKLWDSFHSRTDNISKSAFQPRKNCESCEDYTEVFLCHARLYVFADKYDIGPLKGLSLDKLQRTLAEFTLYNNRVKDIVDLVRYSYSNTTDYSGSIDGLRSLVIHYAACVVENLARNNDFRSLLEGFGVVGRDLVDQMLKIN